MSEPEEAVELDAPIWPTLATCAPPASTRKPSCSLASLSDSSPVVRYVPAP